MRTEPGIRTETIGECATNPRALWSWLADLGDREQLVLVAWSEEVRPACANTNGRSARLRPRRRTAPTQRTLLAFRLDHRIRLFDPGAPVPFAEIRGPNSLARYYDDAGGRFQYVEVRARVGSSALGHLMDLEQVGR